MRELAEAPKEQRGGDKSPSGLVAFLLTDIEGSTRLWQQHPKLMREAIHRHDEILSKGILAHSGKILTDHGEGDSFFAVFERASEALACARDLQVALHREPWPASTPIKVRIAINLGEVVSDHRGMAVNRCARIRQLASGGRVLISQSTQALVQDELPDGLELVDLGLQRLRDVVAPEHVFQVGIEGLPGPERSLAVESASARVVVADDVMLTREGIVRLLSDAGIEVVGQAGDAGELMKQVRLTHPDVAIVDIRMPPTHTDEGLIAAREIRSQYPKMGVLVLSEYVEPSYAMRLIEDYPERVGYLLKERVFDIATVVDALRRIMDAETVIDPTIVSRLIGRRRRKDPLAELTVREREVLGLIAEGMSNRAIASRLFLTERTVEAHVTQILQKLGLFESPDQHRRVLAVLMFLRA